MDGRDRPAAQSRRIAAGEVQDDPADRGAHLHALPGSPAGSAYLQYRGSSHRNCGCSDAVFDGGIPAGGLAGAEAVAKRHRTALQGLRDLGSIQRMERETRLELATPTLARSCSTN